jgi:IclR family acetate operon transcriptional repressor
MQEPATYLTRTPGDAATSVQPDQREFGGNLATARVLLILSRFVDGSESHGVSELSRDLGMTKNMVHRALKTLAHYRYVVRDETGMRYQLGPGVLQLGRVGLEPLNLPRLAEPYLQRMQELSGETSTFSIRTVRGIVTIAGVRGRGDVSRQIPFGGFAPLHASPGSRAVLAFLPDDEIERYIATGPLTRYTPTTLVTADEIWAEVAAVRERGYASALGDHLRGGNGASFPVLANDRTPHGSVTVVGPSDRFTDDVLNGLLPELQTIVAELNRHSQLYAADHPAEGDGLS